jgi:ankyrin repeat protein
LHEAAEFGHEATVRVLLKRGADPNAREAIEGYTPLHEAALHSHLATCKTLVHAGALVNARTGPSRQTIDHEGKARQGSTPLELTREPFRSEFVEVILPQRLP